MKLDEEKIKQNTLPVLVDLLGGTQVIKGIISSDFDLITLCNEGISKASLDVLSRYIGISSNDFFETIMSGPAKAFKHKTNPDNFNVYASSYIIEIAKVIAHAYDVFEDGDKVKRWLDYPSRALNYITPIHLFGTFTGIRMVDDILGRIEHGVYS